MKDKNQLQEMMPKVQAFLNTEQGLIDSKSFVGVANVYLFQYQCRAKLLKQYGKNATCLKVINALYRLDSILNNLAGSLALVHLSGEKSQWAFKHELEQVGLDFVAKF